MEYHLSHSPEETHKLAVEFSRRLKPGDVVGLCGELGSGKTTFMKGIFDGLGGDTRYRVTSPTFTLVHEYPTKKGLLYHLDLFRIERPKELDEIDLETLIKSKGFIFIEWADKFEILKDYCKWLLTFRFKGTTCREIITA